MTKTLHRAREQFLSDGSLTELYEAAVRPEILRSWQRSKRSGARTDLPTLPFQLETAPETPLTIAAEPVISRLAEQLSGLCAGVLLSDRNARIIRRWASDTAIVDRLDRTCSEVGYSGNEELIGTNGIGTATEERSPRIVVGPEHFADILTAFTCVGVPIRNPLSRRFEGTITLATKMEAASPLLLPFFTGIGLEIEQQLLQQASQRERFLLDAFMAASNRGRAVAVIGSGIFMSGPKAQRVLGGVDPSSVWEQIADALHGVNARVAMRTSIMTPDGQVSVTCEALFDDLRLVGALLEVDEAGMVGPGASAQFEESARAARQHKSPAIPEALRQAIPGKHPLLTEVLASAASHRDGLQPVLIVGEPGTGKSTLAEFLGKAGDPDGALRVVECAALSSAAILKSFNHALQGEVGAVLLRHIDALDAPTSRSLSVKLESHLATNRRPRVLATATPHFEADSNPGYRRLIDLIGAVNLELPPLRARSDDIPEVIAQINRRHGGRPLRLSQQAMLALKRAPWPGNIRQLETTVSSVLQSTKGREITVEMLPAEIGVHSMRRQLTTMEQAELETILAALGRCWGNKVNAARALGISRSTLYRKMASYQIDPDESFF